MTLDTTRLDGEQKFPHGLGSEWKPWEAFSLLCLARVAPCLGYAASREARDMAARAPIIASRFVWSGRSGISIGSGTRACFAMAPKIVPVLFCLNYSRGSPGDGWSYLLTSGDIGVFVCF